MSRRASGGMACMDGRIFEKKRDAPHDNRAGSKILFWFIHNYFGSFFFHRPFLLIFSPKTTPSEPFSETNCEAMVNSKIIRVSFMMFDY